MTLVATVTPVGGEDLLAQAVKTVIVVVFLVVGFRVVGKRGVAQLNVYDLVMLMAVSNAVQNAMTAGRGNLRVGLVVATAVLAPAWLATRILSRRPALEQRVVGSPTLLVHDGRVLSNRMRRERVAPEELQEALRQHGLDHASQAAMVVLEVDGSISVVPAPRQES